MPNNQNPPSEFAISENSISEIALLQKEHDEELVFVANRFFYIGLQASEIAKTEKKEIDLEKAFALIKDRQAIKEIVSKKEILFFMAILK